MIQRISFIVVSLALGGCATVVNQEKLKVVTDGQSIVFDKEFRYDVSQENDIPRPKPGSFRGLLKGTYTARYEDAEGIYYANDAPCVIYGTNLEYGNKFVNTGGVWISKVPSASSFRLYWINGKPGTIRVDIGAEPACGSLPIPEQAVGVKPSGSGENAVNLAVSAAQPTTSPLTVGVGAGIAVGIMAAIAESEKGKIIMLPRPVAGNSITGAFRIERR